MSVQNTASLMRPKKNRFLFWEISFGAKRRGINGAGIEIIPKGVKPLSHDEATFVRIGKRKNIKGAGMRRWIQIDDPEGIVFSGNWAMENGAREAMSGSRGGDQYGPLAGATLSGSFDSPTTDFLSVCPWLLIS